MKTIKNIIKIINFIKIKVRHQLSHWPVLYAFIGSIGVILIWRGVWMIADDMKMSGFISIVLGVFISMSVGLFVSFFVGENIIISGLNKEKKIEEKTEEEIHKERSVLREIQKDIKNIEEEISENK